MKPPPPPNRTFVQGIFQKRVIRKLFATVIAGMVFSPIVAQNIVFTNRTDCDFEVKVIYGNTADCTPCYGGPSYLCALTSTYVANCCVCGDCDCNIPGDYSCEPTNFNVLYPVPANTTVSFSPPSSVCRFDILDTNSPQNTLHTCSCNETECICYAEIECDFQTIVIDVTPGRTIKWTYP